MTKTIKNTFPLMILFLIAALIGTFFTGPFLGKVRAATNITNSRISGNDRYETAAKISQAGWTTTSQYAIIATGEDFPDALCAAPLAKKYDAPILLTQEDALPAETIDAIKQLKVKNIFVIGGTGVISTTVENKINSMGIKMTRLFGQDRYETDIKVAEQLGSISEIAIVTGEDFPDALSIAPIAVKRGMPIILIEHNIIPDVVKAYISSHNITKTYVIGAGSSIDASTLSGLTNVEEINGIDK